MIVKIRVPLEIMGVVATDSGRIDFLNKLKRLKTTKQNF